MNRVSVPYIDQPPEFWGELMARIGEAIEEVYFPLPRWLFGSGRRVMPSDHVDSFLEMDALPKCVLLNAPQLDHPLQETIETLFPVLEMLCANYNIRSTVVRDPRLLRAVKHAFPSLVTCTSTLMEISRPEHLEPIKDVTDVLVPASWVVRDHRTLASLRAAFPRQIKLIVNEGCLLRCAWRKAHFQGMNSAVPMASLCTETVDEHPWTRLTSAWILPQHLDLIDGLYDIIKISGRVNLADPNRWLRVVEAYATGGWLPPHILGSSYGGMREDIEVSREFYETTLHCPKDCDSCSYCRDYYTRMTGTAIRCVPANRPLAPVDPEP